MESLAQRLTQRGFWSSIVPALRIEDRASFQEIHAWDPEHDGGSLTVDLDREGYIHLPRCQSADRTRLMADAVTRLTEVGIPPVFCMVFDEFWLPAFALGRIVSVALGGSYQLLPDFWVWHIDPSKGETGWSPHRDKDYRALFPDGRPKAVTAWLALSDAGPLNSCMYVVPANRDQPTGLSATANGRSPIPTSERCPPGRATSISGTRRCCIGAPTHRRRRRGPG